MTVRRVHRRADRTPEQAAELAAARERYQREKPSPDDIAAAGADALAPLGEVLLLRLAATAFRRERERQGLSLAEVADRAGLDPAALSRLESGKNLNPTVATLYRVATALQLEVVCGVRRRADPAPA